MKPKLTPVLLIFALLTAACGGSTNAEPMPLPETPPDHVADLDEAIRAAAQVLLDTPNMQVVELDYGENGELVRTTFLDRRANRDRFLYSAQSGNSLQLIANIWVGGERFCATSGLSQCGGINGGYDQDWRSFGPVPTDLELDRYYLGIDAVGWTEGNALAFLEPVPPNEMPVLKEVLASGTTEWQLTVPSEIGTITRRWLINRDGFLEYFDIRSDTGDMFDAAYTAHEYQFTVLENPDPIIAPEVGTPLSLETLEILGVPEDLLELGP